MSDRPPGVLHAGTSGFAYRGWSPRFYPEGIRASSMLSAYAQRLNGVELNNTFYRQPTANAIATWLAATPTTFRFCVKAQRGSSWRALRGDPADTLPWLTGPYRLFGERLRCVLFRVGDEFPRDDETLSRLLVAWPRDLPLAVELRHPSWEDDAVHDLLREYRAALVVTDTDDLPEPPIIRRTGPFLYLRLRRSSYPATDVDAWHARLAPFLEDGVDACVFFRHDDHGDAALAARALLDRRRIAIDRST